MKLRYDIYTDSSRDKDIILEQLKGVFPQIICNHSRVGNDAWDLTCYWDPSYIGGVNNIIPVPQYDEKSPKIYMHLKYTINSSYDKRILFDYIYNSIKNTKAFKTGGIDLKDDDYTITVFTTELFTGGFKWSLQDIAGKSHLKANAGALVNMMSKALGGLNPDKEV